MNVLNHSCVEGPLPDPKKPRTMHGTLIMKENVSWLFGFLTAFVTFYIDDLQSSGICSGHHGRQTVIYSLVFFPMSTESEAGVVGASPEGTGPQ